LNDYPYLENKVHPVWVDTELGDITRRARRTRLVDITLSPMVRATELREKLTAVQASGELDGGLPIVRDGILYGLLPVPDLEWALDRIEDESTAMCWMTDRDSQTHRAWSMNFDQDSAELHVEEDAVDLLPYIDMSPIALDIHSPMDLVYQCFVKLGLRYICAVSEGRYVGMLHKKAFVRYVKEMEKKG
jgi:chloride channel 3/4/5